MDIKFNKKVLGKREDMRAIWFPGDWQRIIVKRAKEEGMDIYKYVMMLSNNHKIYMDRAAEENEMKEEVESEKHHNKVEEAEAMKGDAQENE